MTRKLFQTYFKCYQNDPDLFRNMDLFTPYQYSTEWVENYIARQKAKKRLIFAVMQNGQPVGEVVLKDIDYTKKECTLGICLQNDSVKGQGIGTKAEQLILNYAFAELGMETVYADSILKNTRSQHVLEKVGFQFTREDDQFKYYRCDRE